MSGESYNNAYSVLENRRLAMRAKYFAKNLLLFFVFCGTYFASYSLKR